MQLVELEGELAHRKAELAFALGAVPPAAPAQEKNHDR
jgi:hypothetical protein